MITLTLRVLRDIVECMENNGVSSNDNIMLETHPFSDDFSIGTRTQVVKYDFCQSKMIMKPRHVIVGYETEEEP